MSLPRAPGTDGAYSDSFTLRQQQWQCGLLLGATVTLQHTIMPLCYVHTYLCAEMWTDM